MGKLMKTCLPHVGNNSIGEQKANVNASGKKMSSVCASAFESYVATEGC